MPPHAAACGSGPQLRLVAIQNRTGTASTQISLTLTKTYKALESVLDKRTVGRRHLSARGTQLGLLQHTSGDDNLLAFIRSISKPKRHTKGKTAWQYYATNRQLSLGNPSASWWPRAHEANP